MSTHKIGVKICGITTLEALNAAISAHAQFIGFVFHPDSPRHITPEHAQTLGKEIPKKTIKVGLFVDPSFETLEKTLAIANLNMIQLHGHETPQKIQEIKEKFNLPVIKALRIASHDDLKKVTAYDAVSDWLLFDTKSKTASGGTGETFDWSLLKDLTVIKPWMLAGGLNSKNISQALSILKPDALDVSSGVEDAPGLKNQDKIKAFIKTVKNHK